jgi:hypothetical protein
MLLTDSYCFEMSLKFFNYFVENRKFDNVMHKVQTVHAAIIIFLLGNILDKEYSKCGKIVKTDCDYFVVTRKTIFANK